MRLILVLLLVALQASCRFVGTACEDACLDKKALVSAIASADRIVVSEHSSGWESIKPGSESLEALPQRLYGEVEFDSPSKAWFLEFPPVELFDFVWPFQWPGVSEVDGFAYGLAFATSAGCVLLRGALRRTCAAEHYRARTQG